MIRLKIVHKGLILVAVPLVVGTAFISLLFYGLSESNRMVDREIVLKDAIISHITASTSIIAAKRCAFCYASSHDPFYRKHCKSNKERALRADEHLRSLLKNEAWAKIPPLHMERQPHRHGEAKPKAVSNPFLEQLQHLSARQNKAALNAMNSLQLTLIAGMIISTSITLALAVFFCLNIRNRLLIILNNMVSLSQGTTLSPPLKGNDEIAELDQFLFKSATEIRDLERFKKEMIGVVSHELKSPLSSVGAFLSSLSAGVFGELAQKTKDKVQRTYNNVKRLMELVKELLFLDRLTLELTPEEITVDEILSDSVDSVRELSEQSGIEIIVKNEGGRAFADRNRLIQVIVNLLSNAMKFSPAHGKVTIETSQKDGWFTCRISDQGRGIPEHLRKQIFEPFKQVDAKDATSKKGTGLGLTISRSIVEQHGGKIDVDSSEGEGSTFWFMIPDSLQTSVSSPPPKESLPRKYGKASGNRSFSVLQQGLVIIAVPLIFQLVFVTVIAFMLNQVHEQTKREENSREILNTLNSGVELLVAKTQDIVMYGLTNKPSFKKSCDDFRNAELSLIEHGSKVAAGNSQHIRDIAKVKDLLDKYTSMLAFEAAQNERNPGFKKLFETGGYEGMLNTMTSGGAETGSMMQMMSSMSGNGKMGTLELMTQMKSQFNRLMEIAKPGIEIKMILDRIMAREKSIGERLSAERSKMIASLQLTFFAGILLNAVVSVFIALTLMKSLSNRLLHVMENTARLAKREALDPPRAGADEIAYLDRTLYETGVHLLELETFKRELISIVSHELRTPLLSISSALELLESGALGDLPEKGKIRLKFAQDEAYRLIRLINDLLDIEKMEAGKFVLDLTDTNVSEVVKTAIASVENLAETKQLKLEADYTEFTLQADRDRLCQVLVNLLSNAIKFSPEGGTINIAVEMQASEIDFRVIDHGKGIPEELRQKIFDRFVQVEKADSSVRGGSGLGLAIAKSLVEQHGGSIGVESRPGEGSTFWFKLPVNQVTDKLPAAS